MKKPNGTIKKWILLNLAFFGLLTSSGFATVINFEDAFIDGGLPIANPYYGLIWNNFDPLPTSLMPTPSGYTAALLSGNTIVFNGNGGDGGIAGPATISSGIFNLNAGYFASAWLDNLQLQVAGFFNGSLMYSNTYTLSATTGTMINFNYQGVDTVIFSSSGGTPHAGFAGSAPDFGMDNLDVTIIHSVLIGTQPTNTSSVAGNSASFSVSAYGVPPFTYQWLFNGTNIIGATNSLLTLTNVQACNEGTYSVVASSLFDSIISSNATLTVTPAPPAFTTQPTIQVLTANLSNVAIFATVAGSLPIAYQWRLNGTNMDGVTNSAFTLNNVQSDNAGYFDVIVSNAYGSITSSIVTLSPALLTLTVGWGDTNDDNGNFAGESIPPVGLAYVTKIAAGGYHSLALNNNGTVIAWGDNSYGQSTIPVGLSNIIDIAAGYYHSLAVKSDGTVVAWGSDYAGEINVPLGLSNVVAVAAGGCDCGPGPSGEYSLALKNDGTVVGWGATTVPLGISNVVAIAGGELDSLALKQDGSIIGWGDNSLGQINPPAGLSNVVAVAAGHWFSLGLKSDGTVAGWGDNIYGETTLPAGLSNVVQIAAGEYFSLALQNNGTVVAWGTGTGPGNFPDNGENIIPPGLSNVMAIAAGARHSLALVNNGNPHITRQPLNWTVYSGMSVNLNVGAVGPQPLYYQWLFKGTNIDGATNSALALVNLQTNFDGNYSVVISNSVGMVISSNATVSVIDCPPIILNQPTNFVPQLGGSSSFGISVTGPIPVSFQWLFNGTNIEGATNAILNLASWSSEGNYSVIVSNAYGIVVSSNASLTLPRSQIVPWGSNSNGQTNVPAGLGNVLAIAAGGYSSMALKTDGTVAVWGYNGYGQTSVPAGLSNVVAIAAGNFYDCLALKSDGTVIGWGLNGYGKATAPAGLSNVIAIAAGDNHTMVLQGNGKVFAWGSNSSGQTNVPAGLSNVVAIAAGSAHSLALRSDGTVIAWGGNTSGQTNVPATLTNAVAIAACANDSLALRSDGTVAAWGDNSYGQTNVPVNLTNAVAISAGASHNLALLNDGTVVGWGNDGSGQTNVPAGLSKVVAVAAGGYHSLALVNDGPLEIVTQPLSQTNYAGMTNVFAANVLGLHPIAYQWQFNGTNIAGATNLSLTLLNVQPTNAGIYGLVATNSFGTAMSSNAILTVIAVPPTLALQPINQTVFVGSNATFTVAAGPGPVPITYQWQFNGTNISLATNASLTLTSVQVANQGGYDIVVSNNFGSVTSSNATLIVTGYPPNAVTLLPAYQTGVVGSNCSFIVTTSGSPPFSYQWQFNGTNISLANNATLTLTNLQFTNQGGYDVVVTNYFGSTTSSNATLVIVTALDLPTALNPGLVWTNTGNTNWFAETAVSLDGEAAQSGQVAAGQKSILQTTVTGPGTLSFWWMFTPVYNPPYNTLTFTTSLSNVTDIVTSTSGWQQNTIYLREGLQVLSWSYSRFVFLTGQSTGWVDQVSFVPGGTAPIIIIAPNNNSVIMNGNATFAVGVVGTPPYNFQWQFNGSILANQTNAILTLSNCQLTNSGTYSVVITNNYGSASTNATLFVQPFAINTSSTNLLMTTNGFQLLMNGILTTNPVIILESTDLLNWLPVYTNPATTGSIQFLDVMATNLPARFYRGQE